MWPPFLILLLGVYASVDVLSLGLGEYQRVAYAALVVLCSVHVISLRPVHVDSPLRTGLCRLWLAVTVIGLGTVALQPTVHPVYVVGDLVSFALPLLFVCYANRRPAVFFDARTLAITAGLLTFSMAVAIVFIDAASNRFCEPSLLLMSIIWVGLTVPTTLAMTAVCLLGNFLVLGVTLLSGARFALLLWLLLGVTPILLGRASKLATRSLLVGMALIAFAIAAGLGDGVSLESLGSLRVAGLVERIASGDAVAGVIEDGSMWNRFVEADDALYTQWTQNGPLEWFLGSGHGATFETGYAYYGDRPLDDGRVHHIHLGLVLLYYRYGVPGVALLLWLIGSTIRRLWLIRRMPRRNPVFLPTLVFSLASLGYLLNLLLFNQLVDPIASFAFAGHLACLHSSRLGLGEVGIQAGLSSSRQPATGRSQSRPRPPYERPPRQHALRAMRIR